MPPFSSSIAGSFINRKYAGTRSSFFSSNSPHRRANKVTITMAGVAVAASSTISSLSISRRHFLALPRLVRYLSVSSDFNAISNCPSAELSVQSIKSNLLFKHISEQSSQRGPHAIPCALAERNDRFSLVKYPSEDLPTRLARKEAGFAKKQIKKHYSESDGGTRTKHPSSTQSFRKAHISFQRLSKVLAACGVASRRSCEELIFSDRVTVNGSVCNIPQTKVHLEKDVIYVDEKPISKELPPKIYFALNKPKGYICSSGQQEYKSVICLFDEYLKSLEVGHGSLKPRLFTAGRLDVATTGLIIVTNDGEFAQQLTHPSSEILKEYIVTLDGPLYKRHIRAVCDGTIVDGVHCIPHLVELVPKQQDIIRHRLRISVNEGRNHEVREIVENSGLKISSLRRVRIGSYRLPLNLPVATFVPLYRDDLKALLHNEV